MIQQAAQKYKKNTLIICEAIAKNILSQVIMQSPRGGSVHLSRFLHFFSGKPTLVTLPDPLLAALRKRPHPVSACSGLNADEINCTSQNIS